MVTAIRQCLSRMVYVTCRGWSGNKRCRQVPGDMIAAGPLQQAIESQEICVVPGGVFLGWNVDPQRHWIGRAAGADSEYLANDGLLQYFEYLLETKATEVAARTGSGVAAGILMVQPPDWCNSGQWRPFLVSLGAGVWAVAALPHHQLSGRGLQAIKKAPNKKIQRLKPEEACLAMATTAATGRWSPSPAALVAPVCSCSVCSARQHS